jgi:hypothetical protein
MISEKKIQHEDDGCASSSSCLRRAGTRGEDDDNLCDCHRFLIFKGVMMRREKRTQKKKRPTCRSSSKFILEKTMKTMEKQDMSVVLSFECCFQAP